jgi:hypothetical protein
MKNIYLLPTDKPSRLFLNKVNKKLLLDDILNPSLKKVLPSGSCQNIYITNDEEIKDGWSYDRMMKSIGKRDNVYSSKIILTTDQDLIKDGVQSIDDEFLEWFVNNPGCESVEVTQLCKIGCDKLILNGINSICCGDKDYKIIIPQEEPKQEIVINEKCSKCGSSQYQIGKPFCTDEFCNTNIGKASEDYWLKQPYNEDAFVEGAKWQAKQMYSKEEVLDAWELGAKEGLPLTKKKKEKLFEQFKKK